MKHWVLRLTRELRSIDRDLFAQEDGDRINIYRYRKTYKRHDVPGGAAILVLKRQPEYIMSLSENWGLSGKPCFWGIEPVMHRIREMDTHTRENWYEEFCREREKIDKSNERKMLSDCEAIASETRSEFKRTFNDFNVSSLAPKRKV